MTFNTGNPVGSTDARDLYDNAQNLDRFSNGEDLEYPDRLGRPRKSLAGIRAEVAEALSNLGYQVIGDYAPGLVMQNYGQVFRKDGEFYRAKAETTLPYPLNGDWAVDAPKFVSVGDAVLRQALAGADGGQLIGFGQTNVAERLSADVGVRQFGAAADGITDDFAAVSSAIAAVAQTGRAVNLGGRTVFSATEPANSYGVRFINGKLLVPSLISGQKTQLNTYADDVNGLMIARENLYAFFLHCSGGTAQNVYLFGDSTVETGGAYPVKPQDLMRFAFYSAGIGNATFTNRGISGTSWSDLNALPDLGASTKLIVIKYGINDAVKPDPLTTMAADARTKLSAIRSAANGGPDQLSILLMGPNSTYRPSTGQDAKWYEDVRNLYLQLCKEFDCAYFDTYAFMQQTKHAPGTWLDETSPGSGEGIHPMPVPVYWIWWDAIKRFVLGDGLWNTTKSNHFWNIGLGSGVVTTATNPKDFPKGKSLWLGLAANGWPQDGVVEVTRHDDGIAEMRLIGQQVVPITMTRSGSGTVWTKWTNQHNAMAPLLNSWANKGGGYNSPGFMVHPDGWVELYGTLTGGTLGASIFQLPANARPGAAHAFATSGAASGSFAVANIVVFADGNIVPYAAANTTISLDGVRYRFGA